MRELRRAVRDRLGGTRAPESLFGYGAELLGFRAVDGAGAGMAPAGPEAALHSASHPAIEWARSGAMALTGRSDGPPRLVGGPLAACARGCVEALAQLAGDRWAPGLDGPALLGERAAILGLSRRGTVSPGGSCRLLPTRDRWIAVNLARPDDRRQLPAWLGAGEVGDPWDFVAHRVRDRAAADVVARARLLGLPAAVAVGRRSPPPPWCRIASRGPRVVRRPGDVPRVVDLSVLWAGPLCAHLLGRAGARVVKVESSARPDGARGGSARFFDLLNRGKQSVALDLGSEDGRRWLRRLVESADIVVESARPRALAQLGIDVQRLVATTPGLTWVSITGYGRAAPGGDWVAFGDDAAVAAGLSLAVATDADTPVFCGDAIADPLTGLHAAVAALMSWRAGGGELLDLALRDVAAHALAFGGESAPARVQRVEAPGPPAWEVVAGGERARVSPPRARSVDGRAPALGADTDEVLAERAPRC